jgi:hypothetical protein
MDTVAIIATLKSERDRMGNVIDILTTGANGRGRHSGSKPGRKRGPIECSSPEAHRSSDEGQLGYKEEEQLVFIAGHSGQQKYMGIPVLTRIGSVK